MSRPIVALVGRPNVGKSTLFNRLAGQRLAVVHDEPGTTRDRLFATVEWNGRIFALVDTGGIEGFDAVVRHSPLATGSADFLAEIRAQTEMAIADADVIIFMAEANVGVTATDGEIADLLRRRQKSAGGVRRPPVLLAVNKGDNPERRAMAVNFYELGLGDPIAISAAHGIGTGDLLDEVVALLPPASPEPADSTLKVAIVGRPNVGKSSLLNRLLGAERVIVSPIAGTTRDAVDTQLRYMGTDITMIDTAGIRRRGRIEGGVEKYSVLRALRAIERADIVAVVVDALEPFTAQDAHIAGMAVEQARSVVVVVNKWDALDKDSHTIEDYRLRVREHLKFLGYVPVLFVSALTGQRVNQLLPTVIEVQAARNERIGTAALNRLVQQAMDQHAPPSQSGQRLRIYFVAQVATAPPFFVFHINSRKLVHFSYTRYLVNAIRQQYPFNGTPLRIGFREREE